MERRQLDDQQYDNITDVPGIKVGNQKIEIILPVDSVIMEEGAICGVDVRGSAPGTSDTDALNPINIVEQVYGICLTGGSVFGLDAVGGVLQFLEEEKYGQPFGGLTIPVVPSAVIFDLIVGDATVRPNRQMGYEAASQAKRGPFSMGNIGAGCGATVGKVAGIKQAMKAGLGFVSKTFSNGLVIGAIVVVNALGEVRDPRTGKVLAGIRNDDGTIGSCLEKMLQQNGIDSVPGINTTIGAVACNANLTKAEATKVEALAQNGLARTIYPVHTMHDGGNSNLFQSQQGV